MAASNPSLNRVANLVTQQIPNDNSPQNFFYDRQSSAPFVVPRGFAFVITDIIVNPDNTALSPGDFFLVVVTIDAARSISVRSDGFTAHLALATGMIVPGPTIPAPGGVHELTARNTTSSTGPVEVQLMGYFVKGGTELGVGMPFLG